MDHIGTLWEQEGNPHAHAPGDIAMYCPACKSEFEHDFDPSQGVHVDYFCCCGQVLQWDDAVTWIVHGGLSIGPPQSCTHPDRRNFHALVPVFD